MLSRRTMLTTLGAGLVTGLGAGMATGRAVRAADAVPAPELTEDGLHRQPWFLESFLELADDLQAATDAGKRFAVMWELKGCPYCKETHYVNFADPEINRYVRTHFDVLQLNLIGSKIVTDFDGEELPEKKLAQKYGIRFTPTFLFFPTDVDGLAEKDAKQREVARAPGYLNPPDFLAMFQFVRQKAYHDGSFTDYLRARRTG